MDVPEIIKKRRSVRQYTGKPIPKDALLAMIEAARFAPTARNVQPWEFAVITDKDTLQDIADLAENGRFVAQATACIAVFCSDTKYYLEDGCAATENILLTATALGIGSCWVAGDKKPYSSQINKLLNAPEALKLISMIALGYPESKEVFKITEKKSLDKLIHWEKF